MDNLRKVRKKIVFVGIGAFLFYIVFILWGDVRELTAVFHTFDWKLIPVLCGLTVLNYLIRFIRWHFLIHRQGIVIGIKDSSSIFLAGVSMTVTPGKMGEVIKPWVMKRAVNADYTKTTPIIVFERLTDGIAMVILSVGGIGLFKQVGFVYIIALVSIIGFFSVVLFRDLVIKILRNIERRIPHKLVYKVIYAIDSFLSHSRSLLSVQILGFSIIIGITAWLCEGTALFLILKQFYVGDLWFTFTTALFLFSFSSILGFLVMVPGGIGVAESSISALLVWALGMPFSKAVFIALLFRFTSLWFGVLFSFPFFIRIIRRPKK
jgi:uncharacterized protein (TIRG00374 family)